MINPKVMCVIVAVGFVLSFVVGMVAGVSIGIALLRGLIIALIFGAIAFVVSFIFKHFLALAIDTDNVQDSSRPPRTGSIVDISIGDEPLPDDENGPDFYVSSEVSVSAKDSVVSEESISKAEVVADKVETSSPQSVVPGSSAKVEPFKPVALDAMAAQDSGEISTDSLDVLPDIGDFEVSSATSEAPVLENTEFATAGMPDTVTSSRRDDGTGVMDTDTIAKAIKTVLSKDS
ncbi:MAG: YrzE family protein [Spirochaetaceae bacterium]|nr:YrzE family protein [Spirochaetaceae bacterium]